VNVSRGRKEGAGRDEGRGRRAYSTEGALGGGYIKSGRAPDSCFRRRRVGPPAPRRPRRRGARRRRPPRRAPAPVRPRRPSARGARVRWAPSSRAGPCQRAAERERRGGGGWRAGRESRGRTARRPPAARRAESPPHLGDHRAQGRGLGCRQLHLRTRLSAGAPEEGGWRGAARGDEAGKDRVKRGRNSRLLCAGCWRRALANKKSVAGCWRR
jgi:hypothetical protein